VLYLFVKSASMTVLCPEIIIIIIIIIDAGGRGGERGVENGDGAWSCHGHLSE